MANAIWIQSQARRDVVELAVYIGQNSVGAANRFLDATDKIFAMLGGVQSIASTKSFTVIPAERIKLRSVPLATSL